MILQRNSWLLFCLILLGVSACRFELDHELAPSTAVSFLLWQTTEGHQIFRIEGAQIDLNWQSSLGWAASETGGFDGRGQVIWVAGPRLLQQRQVSGELISEIRLDSLDAHFVKLGDKTLAFVDTVQEHIGFLNLRREELAIRPLPGVTGQPAYRGGQFYFPAANKVWVYQERAYSPLAEVDFAGQVRDLQIDQREGILVYTQRGDTLFKADLSYNTHRLNEPEIQSSIVKERTSPFRQAYFGKERTNPLLIRTDKRIFNFSNISDFEYDFFDQVLYAKEGDSLLIANQIEKSTQRLPLGDGSWVYAWFSPSSLVD